MTAAVPRRAAGEPSQPPARAAPQTTAAPPAAVAPPATAASGDAQTPPDQPVSPVSADAQASPDPPGSAMAHPDSPPGNPAASRPARATTLGRVRPGRPLAVAVAALAIAVIVGVSVGPAGLSLPTVAEALLVRLPWHPALSVPPIDTAIVWQIRLPRVVLAALVGAMLAGGGAAYQGVFRNPLADPYLLGVAAGAGLGATLIIVGGFSTGLLPPAAFAGAVGAVTITYVLGSSRAAPGAGTASIVLAGVAVAALLMAIQEYLQQQHTRSLPQIYSWILGELSLASWSDVTLILPYVAISAGLLIAHRRLLDVLRVGEAEAGSLGVDVARLRLTVVLAATLGTAAAVAVSGLIGFVGIIVPHTVRLTAGASYRIVLPVSMIGGAAFLVLADVAARTVQAPAEVPIGVITAMAGAPFFLFVLRSHRTRRDLS